MIKLNPKYLNYLIRSIPNSLWPIRWLIIKKSLKKIGVNFKFGYNSEFSDHRLIEIGNNVFMGQNTVINTNVPVIIGDNVMFGRSVTIIAGDHKINEIGIPMRYVKTGGENLPISIENDVWIGSNVLILKGVKISEGCVIGGGSVVTKSMPPYSVCVGNPCRPIKKRFDRVDLEKHLKSVNSKYNIEEIVSIYEK